MAFKCLFVTHKWGDAIPGSGESVTIPHLIDTFVEWGKGQYSVVWTDECFFEGVDIHDKLAYAISSFDPDLCIYTPLPADSLEAQNVTPSAMKLSGRRAVSVFFDLADPDARRLSQKYAAASFLCVGIDGTVDAIGARFLSLWAARTRRPNVPKDIDISFVGARANYADRTAALDFLLQNKIDVRVSGGRAESRCNFVEYMDILDRSLITLNFSKTVAGVSQIKGRVLEALSAGCCLVEDRNAVTARYLQPGTDYVAWDQLEQLPTLLRSLLSDRRRPANIGEVGKATFTERYSASRFWEAIIQSCR